MKYIMKESGIIRFIPESNSFQILSKPTGKQLSQIEKYAKENGRVEVEIGENGAYKTYDSDDVFSLEEDASNVFDYGQRGAIGAAVENPQIHTPEFKNWFGASKVVDKSGKPMVVYHGTGGNFTVFDKSFSNKVNAWGEQSGHFFTPSTEQAGKFATSYRSTEAGGNIKPVYLSLKNPLELDMIKDLGDKAPQLTDALMNAKNKGYDGAIIHNFEDFGGRHDQYIAFSPNQIKSATGNSGAFNPANPDIRGSSAMPMLGITGATSLAALTAAKKVQQPKKRTK